MDASADFRDGMPFLGSRLWIDFVNSAPVALGDLIATPEGWRRWCAAAELGAGPSADLKAIHALRSALARLFECLLNGVPADAADVAAVNTVMARAASHPEIAVDDHGVAVRTAQVHAGDPLVAIVADFADFAAHFEAGRMRHCGNPECSLVFYDTARNGTRRWCSMAACGNRHKVRSHRARAATLKCT